MRTSGAPFNHSAAHRFMGPVVWPLQGDRTNAAASLQLPNREGHVKYVVLSLYIAAFGRA
jgi:hypothetical protein